MAMRESQSVHDTAKALTVPLLLISSGTLFLVDYAGGPGVEQTWPVLLIIAGLSWALSHGLASLR